MSDSRPSSRGGRRGANGTATRSNTNSSANTSSLAKNKTYASLKPEEKKQVEHVKELKPEWSDDQLVEFCGKYNYDANTIQQGLENIFEDAARENADEWTQVKKKASAKPKTETPSAPSQPSSSAAAGPRGASAGRGRGGSSTAPSTRGGAPAARGGAAPRGGRGGPRPSTNAQSKPDAESSAWAHAAAGAGWGDNSSTAQSVAGTATVSQGVPAAGVPPVVVPPNPFTGKDSFLDRLMARDRAKENEKLAAQQAAQKEKEDKERAIREAEERKIREAQEAEDRKIREAQEAQRRLEEEERQRQQAEAEARAQAEAQAAAEAAAAAQAAEEEQRRQAEEAARQQQAALEAEQAAQAMAALQLKQQQDAAAAQAAQSAQADDQLLSSIGARGSGFGNKAPGSAWRKGKEETVVQPAYTAEFQAAEQSTVSALYSPEDPVILPQHLKDQTSAFDAPISFGTFNLPRKTDSATSTTPSFNQSLVSPQEPANRFAQDAQTSTTAQAVPPTQNAVQTQAGDQSDALHQQPSAFMQFPGAMPPAGLGQRTGYEDPQMYNQFYPYGMMPPQGFGGMPGYDENQAFFDPNYSGYGRDARKQGGGIVPGGGRGGNRNFRQGGFPGAGLGPNPVIGVQGKDDKSKLGQGVQQPSKFTSSPPSGAQPQSVSPPPQNDQSPNSAQNGPQAGTPPNFGPVSAAPSAIPNAGSSFDKSRGPKLPRAGGAYQPKGNFGGKGPAGPAAQTFNGGNKQQGTYQNKKQFGGAAGPSGGFNKKSQSFTPSQPQAAGQFQNPNPYYAYNPYYPAAPYYGQYPPGFGRGGFYNPQGYGYPPYGGHQSPTFEENYDKNMASYAGYDASQGQDYSQWGPNSQLPMGQDDGSFAAQGVQAPPSPSAEQNKQQGIGGMDDRLGGANPQAQIGGGRQMGRFQPQQGQQPQAAQQQYGAMPLNLGQQQYNYSVPHQAYPAQGYGYQQPASDPNQQQQYWQS